MPKYVELLSKIERLASSYNLQLQPPCLPDQVAQLRRDSRTRLDIDPPVQYIELLAVHNGLDWDGLSIYGSEPSLIIGFPDREIGGFVEENAIRRVAPEWSNYAVFADTGDDCYCMHLVRQYFCVLDSVSLDEVEQYQSFDDMISGALAYRV